MLLAEAGSLGETFHAWTFASISFLRLALGRKQPWDSNAGAVLLLVSFLE
jgi:hypothetical protein